MGAEGCAGELLGGLSEGMAVCIGEFTCTAAAIIRESPTWHDRIQSESFLVHPFQSTWARSVGHPMVKRNGEVILSWAHRHRGGRSG